MFTTKKLVVSGLFIAMGVVLSTFYIPIGVAKCFPIQHFINVLSAVLLGPVYAVMNAFIISLLRNVLGMGSLLAFPGSMIGALFAGIAYEKIKHHRFACLGEVIGTGSFGGLIAGVIANLLMGKEVPLTFFVIPFFISTLVGSFFALILFELPVINTILRKFKVQNEQND